MIDWTHGSIEHHQSQRPVSRGFPLFKRCEWLVSNRASPALKSLGTDRCDWWCPIETWSSGYSQRKNVIS